MSNTRTAHRKESQAGGDSGSSAAPLGAERTEPWPNVLLNRQQPLHADWRAQDQALCQTQVLWA